MRIIPLTLALLPVAAPAAAHVGHWGALAGHDHWVAGAALGGALIAGILAGLRADRKGRRGSEAEPEKAPEEGAEA